MTILEGLLTAAVLTLGGVAFALGQFYGNYRRGKELAKELAAMRSMAQGVDWYLPKDYAQREIEGRREDGLV